MIWQISAVALYLLGGFLMLTCARYADLHMSHKADWLERLNLFLFWPILAVGCIFILIKEFVQVKR